MENQLGFLYSRLKEHIRDHNKFLERKIYILAYIYPKHWLLWGPKKESPTSGVMYP